jgi:outer membrane protein insertion porin family
MLPEDTVNAGWPPSSVGRKTAPAAAGTLVLVLVSFLLFFPARGATQRADETDLSFKLIDIQVKGVSHLKADDVRLASGLVAGQLATKEDFKRAVDRLAQTGLFTHLSYSYRCSTVGCSLELQATEDDELLPVEFENLVWFGQDELLGLLESRVPLFSGRLPLGGTMPEQVSRALDRILEERKIPGEATCVRPRVSGDRADVSSFYRFKIDRHEVLIANIDFPGAAPAELPALQSRAKPLSGQPYLRTKMREQAQSSFLPTYLARGYLKASFAEPQAKVVEDGARTMVDVSIGVIPGRQYRLGSLQWAGNTALPGERLQEFVHLNPGEPADAVQLGRDTETVRKLYGTRGYVFARVDAKPTIDDALGTVSYQLVVSEGDLYRMGDLVVDGLDQEAAKKMIAQWQMKKGVIFDNSYVARFFKLIYRNEDLTPYDVVPKQFVNPEDKTVSVSLHFKPRS